MVQGIGNYHAYLKSRHWKSVKDSYFRMRPYRCFYCGVRKRLELHHITYKNIGNEQLADLVYLCPDHHNQVTFHDKDGKIAAWLSRWRQNELKKTAKKFSKKFRGAHPKLHSSGSRPKLEYHKIGHGIRLKGIKQKYGLFQWKAKEVGLV